MVPRSAPQSPLSPDLLALLAGCRAAPADDTPRLVLADWLEENADTSGLPTPDDARDRAALIRVQVELARPTCDTGRLVRLRAQEQKLLVANASRWLGDLTARLDQIRQQEPRREGIPYRPSNTWWFTRGLLTVNLFEDELADPELGVWFGSPLAAWVEEAGVKIAGLAALEDLRLAEWLRPYLGVRYTLDTIQDPTPGPVNVPPEQLTAKRWRRLLRCANFAHVRSLHILAPAVQAGILPMLPGANLSGLRWLTVKAPLSDTGAALLAAAPLVNLSALDVSGCEISPDGMRLLANSPHLRELVSLTAFRNRFGCDGLTALARSPLAERLNVLEIQNTSIGDRGIAAMADSPLLDRLVGPGLNLSMNPIGEAGAKALAACPWLERFTEFILRDCRVSDAGAAALAASPHVANLAYLDLWQNRVGDAGARALAASPHLGGVCDLSLRDNLITAAGASALRKRFGARVKV